MRNKMVNNVRLLEYDGVRYVDLKGVVDCLRDYAEFIGEDDNGTYDAAKVIEIIAKQFADSALVDLKSIHRWPW